MPATIPHCRIGYTNQSITPIDFGERKKTSKIGAGGEENALPFRQLQASTDVVILVISYIENKCSA